VVVASLFFGGYQDGFGLVDSLPILAPLVLIGKVLLFLIGMIWVRATLPRLRYDRLMAFGWKIMLPLALVAVMWTAVAVLIGDASGSPIVYAVAAGVFFVVVVGGGLLIMSRSGALQGEPVPIEDDPMITGDRRGLGPAALQVVGGLLAVPFVLYDFTLKQLDRLAALAPEDEPEPEPPSEEASALEVTEEAPAAELPAGDQPAAE
ncbi:NADH-quinone oxidoreductase subunit H, partial [Anaerolineae bacterium CFX9]|nr:NADH-quinone oxidoreductase subunit H [Anaerolineae bacterium CFX9]